ncbi:ATP-binding cassette subfamily B protein [Kribbella steppae]|uniref:ATP-binding cassette subfamily B protein n=1 Tax=Kribbella steppae TaxID=2512223 RepID=A0A4V6NN37_9ACTN|nr:ABC transporter ATP-binding protein [Kribbella steppae]TCO28460.1 ATP-binding cassette subfamily B protein [Kribbella steppae]
MRRGVWMVLTAAFRVSPGLAFSCLAETIGRLLRAATPWFLGLFVAGAIAADRGQMLVAVTALVAVSGVQNLLGIVGTNARIALMERVGFDFDAKIAELIARVPTLEHLESPDYLDRTQTLRDGQGTLGGALNMLLNILNNLAFATGILVVAATADWRLLILAALGFPRLLTGRWTTRWGRAAEEESAAPSRLTQHLVDLVTSPYGGAEARVFGLRQELRHRVRDSATAWQRPLVRGARKGALLSAGISGVFFGAAIGVLGWMTYDALRGAVSVAALVVAVTAVRGLENVSGILTNAVQDTARLMRNVSRFVWLQDYVVQTAGGGTSEPPEQLESGIRLEAVRFRHLGSDSDAVASVDLDLPAGSVVALVGENGAGKSTLVKLLTGLYRPSDGRILVDGKDLAEFDPAAWRSRLSGAFQDFADFELIAREAVGLGDLAAVDDEPRVHQALRDAAAEDVLHALPNGLSTQLGTTWDDGVELSGGQRQRLAIARGLMRHQPLLLVLDEPTSALDPTTEHELFHRYANAAHQARTTNAITLLVTHRFTTVRVADLIVVMDSGRIAEVGTHDELVAAGGQYAELYDIQARAYRLS